MKRRDLLRGGAALAGVASFGPLAAQETRGFHVPAEESPHVRTFMQWPADRLIYENKAFLRDTQNTIADIANTISDFEPVTMLAAKAEHARMRRKLSEAVELWDIPTQDLWCRDSGPIFVINGKGETAVRHIEFNGWGKKQACEIDSLIAGRVADQLGLALLPTDLRGEAGGVEHDGQGLLMAHESSWVNDNRNPGMSRDVIETRLLAAYGAERIIWSQGVYGEDITDYHIDSLARFTGPGRVLINLPDDPDMRDPFHVAALDTYEHLVAAGLNVEVIPEPITRRVESEDFLASYANYYVCNGAVIAPQFGDAETDAIAVDALTRHYPGRAVVTLNVDPLGELGGGIHCATQQMPRAVMA